MCKYEDTDTLVKVRVVNSWGTYGAYRNGDVLVGRRGFNGKGLYAVARGSVVYLAENEFEVIE